MGTKPGARSSAEIVFPISFSHHASGCLAICSLITLIRSGNGHRVFYLINPRVGSRLISLSPAPASSFRLFFSSTLSFPFAWSLRSVTVFTRGAVVTASFYTLDPTHIPFQIRFHSLASSFSPLHFVIQTSASQSPLLKPSAPKSALDSTPASLEISVTHRLTVSLAQLGLLHILPSFLCLFISFPSTLWLRNGRVARRAEISILRENTHTHTHKLTDQNPQGNFMDSRCSIEQGACALMREEPLED